MELRSAAAAAAVLRECGVREQTPVVRRVEVTVRRDEGEEQSAEESVAGGRGNVVGVAM